MTTQQIEQQIQWMRAYKLEIAKSKELALDLLVKTGMYTPTGKLKKAFR